MFNFNLVTDCQSGFLLLKNQADFVTIKTCLWRLLWKLSDII